MFCLPIEHWMSLFWVRYIVACKNFPKRVLPRVYLYYLFRPWRACQSCRERKEIETEKSEKWGRRSDNLISIRRLSVFKKSERETQAHLIWRLSRAQFCSESCPNSFQSKIAAPVNWPLWVTAFLKLNQNTVMPDPMGYTISFGRRWGYTPGGYTPGITGNPYRRLLMAIYVYVMIVQFLILPRSRVGSGLIS